MNDTNVTKRPGEAATHPNIPQEDMNKIYSCSAVWNDQIMPHFLKGMIQGYLLAIKKLPRYLWDTEMTIEQFKEEMEHEAAEKENPPLVEQLYRFVKASDRTPEEDRFKQISIRVFDSIMTTYRFYDGGFHWWHDRQNQWVKLISPTINQIEWLEPVPPTEHPEQERCEAGCKRYAGDEVYHHHSCRHYPDSMSFAFDSTKEKLSAKEKECEEYRKQLEVWQNIDMRNPSGLLRIAETHLQTRTILQKYSTNTES